MKTRILMLLVLMANTVFSQYYSNGEPPFDLAIKPAILWKFKTNGPIVGTPVIENGTVFVGSLDSSLYAIDLASGKLKWKLPTGGGIRSSVCVTPQRLYLLSTDGILYRIAQDSGNVDGLFQTSTGYLGDTQRDFADYFTSTPVIHDSVLYFGAGNNVYALSMNDGIVKWTFKAGDGVHTKPAIHHGKLYIGSFDGYMYALNLQTGNPDWKFKSVGHPGFPKGEFMGDPKVVNGVVLAGSRDYNMYAIDLRGGYCAWMKQFPSGWAIPATVNDSVVYVGTSDDHKLFAFDVRNGYQYWAVNAGFNIFGGVALGKEFGYFGTLGGKVFGIELSSGKVLWTLELDAFTENKLKWLNEEGAYRPDIGKLIRSSNDILKMYQDLGGIFGTPAIDSKRIVIAGYDGTVYCLTEPGK